MAKVIEGLDKDVMLESVLMVIPKFHDRIVRLPDRLRLRQLMYCCRYETSGTTGVPRGLILFDKNMAAGGLAMIRDLKTGRFARFAFTTLTVKW